MTEIRDFPTAVIASISTGILLCKFSEMHEAAEFLMGHPIWTHQFGGEQLCEDMRRAIADQCPGMPLRGSDGDAREVNGENYLTYIAKLDAEIGKTVKIRRGGGLTAMLPTDGIPDHLKDHTIIIGVPHTPQENGNG